MSNDAIPKLSESPLEESVPFNVTQQGIHPKIVQERLGHAGIAITLDLYRVLLLPVYSKPLLTSLTI